MVSVVVCLSEATVHGFIYSSCSLFSFLFQGETKVLKLKNLRPKDFADYTCQVSVRNVCNIEDKSVTFRLTNATSMLVLFLSCLGGEKLFQKLHIFTPI